MLSLYFSTNQKGHLRVIYYILFIFVYNTIHTQTIILDEVFDDWDYDVTSYTDKQGDGNSSGIDFTDVKISNDDRLLFIYFDLNKEINLQEGNNIILYIDIDNNAATGLSKNGMGADIVYNFGQRRGQIHRNIGFFDIYHDDVGLITSPTVTSDRFEMCLLRNFSFGNLQFFLNDKIKILLSDENTNGDKAPDIGGYEYIIDKDKKFIPIDFAMEKQHSKDLRVVSYNVLRDNLFNNGLRQNYRRIFQAIKPDIIGFCEIYNNTSAQTAALIETFLPSVGNQTWYHASVNPDIRLVSRYPIVNARSIDGNGAFHINLGEKQLLYIVAHLPCCTNDRDRQAEVDKIMAFVRSVKFGISPFALPLNSPIIIVGDMNFVGQSEQLNTFLTGDISNNSSFGPDFNPDWDDTPFEDAKPITTNLPLTFTWYSETSSYSAGRLDYVIYSGSQMKITNSFALWTPMLSAQQLTDFGLQMEDVVRASDHLPVIADFDLDSKTSTTTEIKELPFSFTQHNGQVVMESEYMGRILVTDITGKVFLDVMKDNSGQVLLDFPTFTGLYIFTFYTEGKVFSTKLYR